ncbi:F-box protein At3g07870 [Lactuca sativa]|uniref:F-box protein At3g07870 n=1 Tax=Lactuca sativa TaxID=4236 RepID=UPI000CC9950F|nr:F-box protein At3g07870 [Lactuca sativa]XP_023748049.1 F-box protein At3g07870 [Lactuca sativa]XP_023748050.1 F-box protein At3g07870 [Lactuca sativa]
MSLREPCMEDLPVAVMVDILSRLPVKTIIHCKCVCKQWQNIVVFDSYFADLQLSRSSPPCLMIYYKPGPLKWVEVEEGLYYNLHHHPVMSLDINIAPMTLLVGSVRGLVCLWQVNKNVDNTYICNPMTREYMILPRPQYYREGTTNIVYCFGVSSLTREYKVIRIFQRGIIRLPDSTVTYSLSEAEVYTLGTGQWRSLGHVPYWLNGSHTGPFLNGHAHWIIRYQVLPEKICAFDFDKETFELFPSPPSEVIHARQKNYFQKLDLLKGCLCLCATSNSKFTVWVMKEYGIKNSWHKELVIRKGISRDLDMLILGHPCLIECFKDGTILMASSGNNLLVYSPVSKTVTETKTFDGCFKGLAYRPGFHRLLNFKNEIVKVF